MTSPSTGPSRAAMLIVFLIIFIDLLGFGIVLPLLPRYAKKYLFEYSDVQKGIIIGIVMSVFSAMQFFFAPAWGRLSDRIGRRPVLLIGLAGSVLFYSLFGFASSLDPATSAQLAMILILVSRIGAGICGANIAVAQAVIADCTTLEKRSSGMALIGAAFGIGFTFGPLIGAGTTFFAPDSPGLVGYVAAGICLVALIIAWRKLPETYTPAARGHHRGLLQMGRLMEVLKTPVIGVLVLSFFLATYGFANFETSLSLFTESAFQYTESENFLVFAFTGFMLMFAQGYLYRKLAKKHSELPLMKMGLVMMLTGLLTIVALVEINELNTATGRPSSGSIIGFLLGLAVSVTGFSFLNPSINSLVSKAADPTRQGETLGVNQSFAALARILGPITATSLIFLEPRLVLPYLVAAGMMIVVMFITRRMVITPTMVEA
jgi:MFS transporter, DHA1 family, tetracycline resistance protein